ncbi:MAG: hypothetical protein WCI59_13540 [Betaproteobacteria bacterium]
MSDLAWTKAAALLKLIRADGWPDSLSIERLALLQAGHWDTEAKAIAATLKDACKASRLSCSAQEVTPRPPPRVVYQPSPFASREWAARDFPRPAARPAPPPPVTVYELRPEVFAGWLAQNKLQPTELVAAWFDATGTTAVVQLIAQAAPELSQPAAGAKVGSAHRPSDDDLLQELERQRARKMRGALQRTADHFGLDRSMVGKACKRAEKARAAKYGKNPVPPNDPLSRAWGGAYVTGKKVKTPPH